MLMLVLIKKLSIVKLKVKNINYMGHLYNYISQMYYFCTINHL